MEKYNFAAVFYACETWSLTLREERRLRLFENRVLKKIFGPGRDEVTGGLGKVHNEEFHNLYTLLSIIVMLMSLQLRWAGCLA
jgi:hypothetical protein